MTTQDYNINKLENTIDKESHEQQPTKGNKFKILIRQKCILSTQDLCVTHRYKSLKAETSTKLNSIEDQKDQKDCAKNGKGFLLSYQKIPII